MSARNQTRKPNRPSSRSVRASRPKKRVSEKFTKIVALLVVGFAASIVLGGYVFYNSLTANFVSAESATSMNPNYTTALFVVTKGLNSDNPEVKNISYKIFNFENTKVMSYEFDQNYKLDTGSRFGDAEVSKLLALGSLDANGDSEAAIEFVNKQLFKTVGFPVDYYLYIDEEYSGILTDLLKAEGALNYLLSILALKKDATLTTNLELNQLYSLSTFVTSLPEDRLLVSSADMITSLSFTEELREMSLSSQLAKEAKNIAILNASSEPGVATFGANVVTNLGGRVVAIDNSNTKFGEDFIVTYNTEDYTTKYLAKVFGIAKILNKEEARQYVDDDEMYRADIMVFFGK